MHPDLLVKQDFGFNQAAAYSPSMQLFIFYFFLQHKHNFVWIYYLSPG